jgi:hypothetical protein
VHPFGAFSDFAEVEARGEDRTLESRQSGEGHALEAGVTVEVGGPIQLKVANRAQAAQRLAV